MEKSAPAPTFTQRLTAGALGFGWGFIKGAIAGLFAGVICYALFNVIPNEYFAPNGSTLFGMPINLNIMDAFRNLDIQLAFGGIAGAANAAIAGALSYQSATPPAPMRKHTTVTIIAPGVGQGKEMALAAERIAAQATQSAETVTPQFVKDILERGSQAHAARAEQSLAEATGPRTLH